MQISHKELQSSSPIHCNSMSSNAVDAAVHPLWEFWPPEIFLEQRLALGLAHADLLRLLGPAPVILRVHVHVVWEGKPRMERGLGFGICHCHQNYPEF